MKPGTWLEGAIRWAMTILVPVVLVLGAVRFLMTPAFIRLEYRMPNFPPDPYGLSMNDRLRWAEVSRQYLLNDAGIEFLADLYLEDGNPLYNQRELRHMVDVKNVVKTSLIVLYSSLIGLIIIGIWAWRSGWWTRYWGALSRGGWLTVGLIGAIIIFVLVSFNTFFVSFHRVFFEGDTWLFRYSDTLIRLFPLRFWQDAFIFVGSLALVGGFVVVYLSRLIIQRRFKS
ncbi:MAG: TIGR01906 family membrane protein [Anaerolineales bacterium]|jgi:integral membrane protein (TIGR01906 family)